MPSPWREYKSRYQKIEDPYPRAYYQALGIQTYLGTIETSVERPKASIWPGLRQSSIDLAQKFLSAPNGPGCHNPGTAMLSCSETYAVFQVEDELQIHAYRCRNRACPICSGVRAGYWERKTTAVLKFMTSPKHVTLTVSTKSEDLEYCTDHLIKSFRRLRQTDAWKRYSSWGYWTMEIKRNEETGVLQPHLHIIANMKFFPFHELQYAWACASRGSTHVYIEAISGNLPKYLAKYISKCSTIFQTALDPVQLYGLLKGRRFVQKFGKFPKLPQEIGPEVHWIGTIKDIIEKAGTGSRWAEELATWLCKNHPGHVKASCQFPPPPCAEFSPLNPVWLGEEPE